MEAVQPVLKAYEEGHAALLLTGRSLQDVDVDSDGRIRTLLEGLRRDLRAQHGLHLITYAFALGLDWDEDRVDPGDRPAIEALLERHGLLDIPLDNTEVVRVIRGIASLARTPVDLTWQDGRPLRLAFLILFSEHLAPGSLPNGTQSDQQLMAIELAFATAQSLALRATGHLVIFHGREGLIDELLVSSLHHLRLPQPDEPRKLAFVNAALHLYESATFDEGLSPDAVARLTTNTPNRGLEAMLRASHRSGRPLSVAELVERKSRDVVDLSEGTLGLLDPGRVDSVHLSGTNVSAAALVLEGFAEGLARGDPNVPANVLLVGPPGVGKTDLAILVARKARAAAYQMHSPKSGIVGETERKARLQQELLKQWEPCVAFVDEVTEALPLERGEFDGDSGATRAVSAALLTSLSDEKRRGKSLLIATTNCPWRMGAAMRSRFTAVPVLYPLCQDFPEIIVAIGRRVDPNACLDADDDRIKEAAEIFFRNRANPRHVLAAVSHARLAQGAIGPETILQAAIKFCGETDELATVLADLWAVRLCSHRDFLPWNGDPTSYPFPAHLQGVVDPATGNIDHLELRKRIQEIQPQVSI